jgi:phosphoribosyl 1,2-cyclic phosphodiesterase
LVITSFPKIHDALEPHSFIVACGEIKIGVFTDLGRCCDQLIAHFKQCHAAFLEANYDEHMLESWPLSLAPEKPHPRRQGSSDLTAKLCSFSWITARSTLTSFTAGPLIAG